MPGPYGSIGTIDLANLDAIRTQMQGCPGGRIMLKLTQVDDPRPTLNMSRLCNALYAELVSNGWRWVPTEPGGPGSGPAILDWTRTSGECQYVARALALLLTAPRPLGFAIGAEHVTCVNYSGAEGNGFIAKHAEGTLQSHCNIWNPATKRLHGGIRRWGDHWVVHVRDMYWDACYNQAYQRPADMALVEFVGDPILSVREKLPAMAQRGVSAARPELNGLYRTVPGGSPEGLAGAGYEGPLPG